MAGPTGLQAPRSRSPGLHHGPSGEVRVRERRIGDPIKAFMAAMRFSSTLCCSPDMEPHAKGIRACLSEPPAPSEKMEVRVNCRPPEKLASSGLKFACATSIRSKATGRLSNGTCRLLQAQQADASRTAEQHAWHGVPKQRRSEHLAGLWPLPSASEKLLISRSACSNLRRPCCHVGLEAVVSSKASDICWSLAVAVAVEPQTHVNPNSNQDLQ